MNDFSAAKILAISIDRPESLFTAADKVGEEKRALAKKWHPDHHPEGAARLEAEKVIAHINALADSAKKKADAGIWRPVGIIEMRGVDGKKKVIRYRKSHPFELGEAVYGPGAASFVLQNDFADLFHAARTKISGLAYRDDAMKKEFSRYMPEIVADFETVDKKCVMVMKKTADVFLLADVVDVLAGRMDPKHVAWVMNSVYNIACLLDFNKLTHNGISLSTVFISPSHHSAMLLGGWWYATSQGSKLSALPALTHRFAPPDLIREKRADIRLDLAMIKALGRALLGDVTGMNLKAMGAPEPMIKFLRQPTAAHARQDYAAWDKVLKDSFGPRRFTELKISESDIFKD